MGSSVGREFGFPFGPRVMARYEARRRSRRPGHQRRDDRRPVGPLARGPRRFAVRSHQLAARATAEGRFENEIVPVAVRDDEGNDTDELMTADEGIRPDSSLETLAKLKPAFKEGGKVTAGNSSQITDGASAVLIMSEEKATALGLHPAGAVPRLRPGRRRPGHDAHRPDPGHPTVLERAKLTMDDIDLVEINEAFASVVLAWEKELHPDMARVNVNGGAIALGHPLGRLGGQAHGHPAERARAHRRPLRPAHHVRGRRNGQRHHHRAPRLTRHRRWAPDRRAD